MERSSVPSVNVCSPYKKTTPFPSFKFPEAMTSISSDPKRPSLFAPETNQVFEEPPEFDAVIKLAASIS